VEILLQLVLQLALKLRGRLEMRGDGFELDHQVVFDGEHRVVLEVVGERVKDLRDQRAAAGSLDPELNGSSASLGVTV
jgi:hypothetical protein